MSAPFAILFFVVTIMFLILIHELGHFITAKRSGIKVLEFGLFLPPRIWGKQHGETLYSINWIPLGGFCKMLGEDDPSDPRSLAAQSPKTRLIVLSAGSLVMLIFPIILWSLVYMVPHDFTVGWEEQIEVVDIVPGSPGDMAGIEVGDRILAMDDQPITSSDKLQEVTDDNPGKEIFLTVLRDGQPVDVFLVPREQYPDDEGPLGIVFQAHSLIVKEIREVVEGSPAYEAGLKKGDEILAINGTVVLTDADYQEIMADVGGKETLITVVRDDQELTVALVPRLEYPEGQGPMGVRVRNNGTRIKEHKSYLPWTAVGKSLDTNKDMYVALKDSLDQITFDQMGGVVAAGDVTVEIAKDRPWEDLVLWASLLSVNLGIINLFPIPALDGGRIVFVLLEIGRRGKRISPEKEGMVHLVGFVMLIAFMVFIMYQDIDRIISGESLLP